MELERIQARVERLYLGFSNQAPTTQDHPPTQEHGIARTCRIDSVLLLSTARRRALSCRDRPWPIQSDSERHSLCHCVLRLVFCRRTLLSKYDIIMLYRYDVLHWSGKDGVHYDFIHGTLHPEGHRRDTHSSYWRGALYIFIVCFRFRIYSSSKLMALLWQSSLYRDGRMN